MANKEKVKSLLKEAELYRTQGLSVESREKYRQILQLIEKDQGFADNEKLINTIKNKIMGIEKDLAVLDEEIAAPELSQEVQDLIKRLFSFSKNKDAAAIEGAVALAKFGQYERALAEFNRLLEQGALPLVAAKNIIRCHLALSSTDAAIDQFRQWVSGELLSTEQLRNIRSFLADILKKKGTRTELPEVVERGAKRSEDTEKDEVLPDIFSVVVKLENGPRKGSMMEFDVTFQSGNVISLIISEKDHDLVDSFKSGVRLRNLEFYSRIAIFKGDGIISGNKRINTGPKRGDYVLDITIDSN
ncbi:MAG: tetratricopeptide repeat protein [Desulfobacterales bacterium]|nr:tetratricopeptide repeat protein [Desulfobacterales bacterium]